ncbi:hypothetical protein [Azohydromonas sediminis]|uniref:hypothetical protein n=1 Tax=Azohydromonas sediminis TaxID=2259674 RepID=UPI000E65E17B|nr:hypothetical protein [Azohydromonas sediminis]
MRCIDRQRAAAVAAASLALAGCMPSPPPSPPAPPATPQTTVPAPAALPVTLPRARNWDEYRERAARRLVAANPGRTYDGPVSEPLLAIPVLEAELNADGSIRRIKVLREPRQAKDTVPMAIEAMRRAAPFGDVSHLPRPWTYVEVFLYDDARKFKPRTLER